MDSTLFEDFYFMDIFSDDDVEKKEEKKNTVDSSEFESQEVIIDCDPELTNYDHLNILEDLEKCIERDIQVCKVNGEENFEISSFTPYLNKIEFEDIDSDGNNQENIFKIDFEGQFNLKECTSTPFKGNINLKGNQNNEEDEMKKIVKNQMELIVEKKNLNPDQNKLQILEICENENEIVHQKKINKFNLLADFNADKKVSEKIEIESEDQCFEIIDKSETKALKNVENQSNELLNQNVFQDAQTECSLQQLEKNEVDLHSTEMYASSQSIDFVVKSNPLESIDTKCQTLLSAYFQDNKAHETLESDVSKVNQAKQIANSIFETNQVSTKLSTSKFVKDENIKSNEIFPQLNENYTTIFETNESVSNSKKYVPSINVEDQLQVYQPNLNVINHSSDSFLETQVFEAIEALTMTMESKHEKEERSKKQINESLNQIIDSNSTTLFQAPFQSLSECTELDEFEDVDLNSAHSEFTPFKPKHFKHNDTVDMLADDLACLALANKHCSMTFTKNDMADVDEKKEEETVNESFQSAKSCLNEEPEIYLEKFKNVLLVETNEEGNISTSFKKSPVRLEDVNLLNQKLATEIKAVSSVDLVVSSVVDKSLSQIKTYQKRKEKMEHVEPVDGKDEIPLVHSSYLKENFFEKKDIHLSNSKLDDDFLINDDLKGFSFNFKSKLVPNSTLGNLEDDTLQILDLAKLDSELAPIDCLNVESNRVSEKELSSIKSDSSLSNELEVAFIRSKLDMTLGSIREVTFDEITLESMNELKISKIEDNFEMVSSENLNSSNAQNKTDPNKSINLMEFSIVTSNHSLNQNARKNFSTPKSCLKFDLIDLNKGDINKTERQRKMIKTVTFVSPDFTKTTRKSSLQKIVRTPIAKKSEKEVDENLVPNQIVQTPKQVSSQDLKSRSPLIKIDLHNSPLNTSISKSISSKPKTFVSKLPTLVSRKPVSNLGSQTPSSLEMKKHSSLSSSKIKSPNELGKAENFVFKIPTLKPHKDTPRTKPGQNFANRSFIPNSSFYNKPLF